MKIVDLIASVAGKSIPLGGVPIDFLKAVIGLVRKRPRTADGSRELTEAELLERIEQAFAPVQDVRDTAAAELAKHRPAGNAGAGD